MLTPEGRALVTDIGVGPELANWFERGRRT
jgi:hypothetical protein